MAEYASNGKGNLGVTLGAIGTGLSALGGNNLLGGLFGNNCTDSNDRLVSRYELGLTQENAILRAQGDVDAKLVKVYETLNNRFNTLENMINSNAAAQAVINCGFNSSIGILQTQVNGLLGMTKMVIPSTNICNGTTTDTTTTT